MNSITILKDKTTVATGSPGGIGLACARTFARAGANVVLNGNGVPAEVVKERAAIEADFGVKAIYSTADMSKPRNVAEMIALGAKAFEPCREQSFGQRCGTNPVEAIG